MRLGKIRATSALLLASVVLGTATTGKVAQSQDTIVLRLAHVTSDDSAYSQASDFLNDRLQELTNGRIEVREFSAGALGSETSTLDLYASGDIDLGFHYTPAITPVVSEMGFFDTPFLFDSFEHWQRTMVSPEAKKILQGYLESGGHPFSIAMVGLTGERNIYTKGITINSMEDLDGLKLRLPESPVAPRLWRAIGVAPIAVAWTDVYSALETGLVDAVETTPGWYYDSKHIEVANVYNWTRHMYGTTLVFIANSTLERIPEELHDELSTAFAETEKFWTKTQLAHDRKAVEEHFEEYNVVQNDVPKEVRGKIRKRFEPFAKEVAEKRGATDMLRLITERR